MTSCLLLLPLWDSVVVLCFVVRYFMSILVFAIILIGKRKLVASLSLSSWCLVVVVWLFLAVPWVCLQFVIVVFPDHTNLLFLMLNGDSYILFCKSLILIFFQAKHAFQIIYTLDAKM